MQSHHLIEACLAGNLSALDESIADFYPGQEVLPSREDDDYAFLNGETPPVGVEAAVNRIRDGRGYQLLDLICEAAVEARVRGVSAAHLAPVTMALIVRKGARPGDATLRLLFSEQEYAGFVTFAKKVQCFRRTMGLFGLAAFGFSDLGQRHVLFSQGWAVRRLYGVASIIHDGSLSSNISTTCQLLHPAFLEILNGEPSPFRLFASRMAAQKEMMNSIRDNHAHRLLTTLLKTPRFEREVIRFACEPAAPSERREAALTPLIQQTVLLVDDRDDQRLKIAGWLTARGFRVHEAADGSDALTFFDRNRSEIELVLTDFGMPEMDGFNLAANLRKRSVSLPIIINTTPPIHPDLRQEANRMGVTLIPKFDENLLHATIKDLLAYPNQIPS